MIDRLNEVAHKTNNLNSPVGDDSSSERKLIEINFRKIYFMKVQK